MADRDEYDAKREHDEDRFDDDERHEDRREDDRDRDHDRVDNAPQDPQNDEVRIRRRRGAGLVYWNPLQLSLCNAPVALPLCAPG